MRRDRRQLRQRRGIGFRGTGENDGPVVARRLAIQVNLSIEPPHRGMPARNRANGQLQHARRIIMALHVRPFVHDDAIEIAIVESIGDRG